MCVCILTVSQYEWDESPWSFDLRFSLMAELWRFFFIISSPSAISEIHPVFGFSHFEHKLLMSCDIGTCKREKRALIMIEWWLRMNSIAHSIPCKRCQISAFALHSKSVNIFHWVNGNRQFSSFDLSSIFATTTAKIRRKKNVSHFYCSKNGQSYLWLHKKMCRKLCANGQRSLDLQMDR